MKKVILAAAFLMGLATVSFAGNPKESKEVNNETPTVSKTEAGVALVWYKVTYDGAHPTGYIPSGTPVSYNGERSGAEALEECEVGTNRDCLRGFSTAPTLPTSSTGSDQIKTDEQP